MVQIPKSEIDITTSRSGGPGGQHVNTTSSRVTLRWDVTHSQALSPEQKQLVRSKLKSRINLAGELILHVDTFRSQIMNRERAYERLQELINQALETPKKRFKTRISNSAKARRLEAKKRTGTVKKLRQHNTLF